MLAIKRRTEEEKCQLTPGQKKLQKNILHEADRVVQKKGRLQHATISLVISARRMLHLQVKISTTVGQRQVGSIVFAIAHVKSYIKTFAMSLIISIRVRAAKILGSIFPIYFSIRVNSLIEKIHSGLLYFLMQDNCSLQER